jgi:hypothetical protein
MELLLTSRGPTESESLPLVVLSTLPFPVIIDILLYLRIPLSKSEAVEVGLSVKVRIDFPVGGNFFSCLSPL